MSASHENLSETNIVGDDTHMTMVRAEQCRALGQRHIAHVGVGDAAAPYQIVRTHLSGSYLLGCLGGEGRMLLDGRWRPHRSGMTSLAPAHVLHAFHAIASKPWQVCWVRYLPSSPRSKTGTKAPVMARFDSAPLSHAILDLDNEMRGAGDAGSCALWVDLIERYVSRFAEPWRGEERLFMVWDTVGRDLARPWTLEQLAAIARTSSEHLRRL